MTLPFPIEEYPIVIGIDFGKEEKLLKNVLDLNIFFYFFSGTTYSGVSYAFGNDSEIVDITKW